MRTVNHCLIEAAMGYLVIAEANAGQPLEIDPDNESSVKSMASLYISPEVRRWPSDRQSKLMLSLAYYVKRPEVLSHQVLANIQDLSMKEPANVSLFFTWIAECLFPAAKIEAIDLTAIKECNDVFEING